MKTHRLQAFSLTSIPLSQSTVSSSLPVGSGRGSSVHQPKGHLHFIIAGSSANRQLCRTLLSATVNRYGPPVMAGWNATGKNDAAVTHLAKLRVVAHYLESIEATADDDLFLMVDGYDVLMQFGPDVLVERYFAAVAIEDERIIQQLGPANAERVAGPLGRHIFFGADKVCWPIDWRRPACWAVPDAPHMDKNEFGPFTDNGDMTFNRPRWLNSGTILGPIKEVREMFQATLAYINKTYDADYEFKESDQFYLSEVWGEQEVDRIAAQLAENPEESAMQAEEGRFQPELVPGHKYNYHIAIDYASDIFQPWAGNERWIEWYKFNGPRYSITVNDNFRNIPDFKPWEMHMQGDTLRSLDRIFRSTPELAVGNKSTLLIHRSAFGANFVTKKTFPVYHCTGPKDALDHIWPRMWFFPYAEALVRASLTAGRGGEPFAPYAIDNRIWYAARQYPKEVGLNDGGAWSDGSDEKGVVEWLSFDDMCEGHRDVLFGEETKVTSPRN